MGVADRYLADLGVPREEPSLTSLSEITRRHVARYAFASIGPRLGDALPIDPEELLDRIVARRRGGYCFEQNGLLFAVLEELGYQPRLQMARVLVSGNPHPGLTHRVTRVTLDGEEYLVDVGFGPQGPPHPVPLQSSPDSGSSYRIVRPTTIDFRLDVLADGEWRPLYRFDDVAYGQADAELGHFYSHRHPEAAFVNALVGSRILDDEVRSLRDREYHVIRDDGRDVAVVSSADHLHAILTDQLGLQVTETESDRLFQQTEPSTATGD